MSIPCSQAILIKKVIQNQLERRRKKTTQSQIRRELFFLMKSKKRFQVSQLN